MSMRHPDLDYMIVMERRNEELAEAQRYRMIKEAQAASRLENVSEPSRLFILGRRTLRAGDEIMLALARFLSFAGGLMLTWSCRLRTHYEMLLADSVASDHRPSPCA